MTFEQEVWDVICAAAIHAGHGKLSSEMADLFAPRVAAAIQVEARDFGQDIASAEQAALRALRGETP